MKFVLITFTVLCIVLFNTSLGCIEENLACVAPNKKLGVCINIMRCTSLIKKLKNLKSQVPEDVAKFVNDFNCGMDGEEQKVCCVFENTPCCKKLINTDDALNENGYQEPKRIAGDNDDYHTITNDDQFEATERKMISMECGNYEGNRISNGKVASLLEFPWMALLVYETSQRNAEFGCGGTIISDRFILTAAHCVVDKPNYMLIGVRVGEYDISSPTDCEETKNQKYCSPETQDFSYEKVITHPLYSSRIKFSLHDIGLVKLSKSIDMSKRNIMPICLPFASRQNAAFEAKSMTAAGWGLTEKNIQPSLLLKVELPLVSYDNCSKKLGMIISPGDYRMCAGGEDSKDTCSGDSGGPLMMLQEIEDGVFHMVQHGVTSFGAVNCGTLPAVYTKIAPYIDWIIGEIH